MKKIISISILSILILMSGCMISKQYLKRGQYDLATKESVKKLQRRANKEKQILVLEEAYPKAIQQYQDRINFLHTDGQPDRWNEIYKIYSDMDALQVYVETVTPLFIDSRQIDFTHVNYDSKIVDAKIKAADYFYAHAKLLMDKNDKFSYRQAFEEFNKVEQYTSKYTDVDDLMMTCYNEGLSHLIIIAVNSTPFQLPNDFMINLIDFPVSDLNSFWINYYSTDKRNGNYDVSINVTLTIADVSPNNISTSEHTETKDIKDGWEYKLDGNGKIMTDTAGNKIKIVKYKTIRCNVYNTRQFKQAHIEGAVNYIDTESNQIVRSVPIAADHTFEHFYTTANGNLDALSSKTRSKLKERPAPYPNDIDMIYAANNTLRDVIFQVLRDNRNYIQLNY